MRRRTLYISKNWHTIKSREAHTMLIPYAKVEFSPELFIPEFTVNRYDNRTRQLLSEVPRNTVIATSTWYESKDGVMKMDLELRARLALEFCKKASELGYKTVVVDGGSDKGWRQTISSLENVVLLDQQAKGFMAGRQEAYLYAANDGRKIIAASEPEKHPLVQHKDGHSPLAVAALPVYMGLADGTIPRRTDGLASYPAQQAVAEADAALSVYNLFVSYAKQHGLNIAVPYLDQQIGPRILDKSLVGYLLHYPGFIKVREPFSREDGASQLLKLFEAYSSNPQGDFLAYPGVKELSQKLKNPPVEIKSYSHAVWEGHFVPFWKMILDGKHIGGVPVEYIHPREQTELESIDLSYDDKRNKQLITIATAARRFLTSHEQGLVDW